MAIIAEQTAPNFAVGNYFRILKLEMYPDATESYWLVYLGFYASAYARDMNPINPLYQHVEKILVSQMSEDYRDNVYLALMDSPLFAGTNAISDEEAT